MAQTGAGEVSEVVVTGSRIARTGFTAPTPVTVVGLEQIQRQGATDIAQVLQELPSFSPSNSNRAAGAVINNSGVFTANLRNLGGNRTLVLVNGRRFVASTLPSAGTASGAVDLNLIPTSIIARTDVVTGGASATYGSDAVAGVVNIILNDRLEGLRATLQFDTSKYNDNHNYSASAAYGRGFADDRGHIVVAGEYVDNKGVTPRLENGRPWSTQAASTTTVTNPCRGVAGTVLPASQGCTGNIANGLPANIRITNAEPAIAAVGGVINAGPLKGTWFSSPTTTQPFNYGYYFGVGTFMSGGQGPNGFNEFASLATPVKHYALYSHGLYKLTDTITASIDASFGHSESRQVTTQPRFLATAGATGSNAIQIRNDNAYLPASVVTAMAAVRPTPVTTFNLGLVNDAWGPYAASVKRNVHRVAAGLDGKFDIGDRNWSWNAYYQYGHSRYNLTTENAVNVNNLIFAVDSVRNAAGQIVCRATQPGAGFSAAAAGCAPINPFGNAAPTAEAKAYVFGTQWNTTNLTSHVAAAEVQGDLFNLPAGPVTLAVGAEYRSDSATAAIDPVSAVSGWQVISTAAVTGKITVKEGYGELAVPLLKDFVLAKNLSASLAFRRTDYSTSGAISSWKVGGIWDLTDWLRFRVTRSRDIRAPNLFDLYFPQAHNVIQVANDTVTGINLAPATTGGNPDLVPETAKTWTIGAVLQAPGTGLFRGARLSVDYYDIDLKNGIANLGTGFIVQQCNSGNAALCPLVTRDPTTRIITDVHNTLLNVSSQRASGYDIEFAYRLPLERIRASAPGNLGFNVLASHVSKFETIDPSGAVSVGAGYNGTAPSWRVNASLVYDLNRFSANVRARFISAGKISNTNIGPDDPTYSPALANSINTNTVGSVIYWSLGGQYDLWRGEAGRQAQVFLNIDNLFNRAPPFTYEAGAGFYDVFGRTFRMGVRLRY